MRKRERFIIGCLLAAAVCLLLFAALPAVTKAETGGDYEYSVLENGEAEITKYLGSETEVVIPGTIEALKVTSIGKTAFANCTSLESITIPDSVTSIGEYAFQNCSSLLSITIPKSVTSIGEDAFISCSSLSAITVDSSNTKYDSREGCNAIIDTESNTLLAGCKNTVIPTDVTSIGAAAFYGCTGLSNIEIPASVTSIGEEAFFGCIGLTGVVIPDSVTSIGDSAFFRCSSLPGITIPKSVTSIGDSAFVGCSSLSTIKVDSANTVYDSRDDSNAIIATKSSTLLFGCAGTVIPYSVTDIGKMAFSECSGLSGIKIPDGVTSIGDVAFSSCSSLSSITIPKSVTSIGSFAFLGCSSLSDVFFYGTEEDRNNINIPEDDMVLLNAAWHYPKKTADYEYFELGNEKAEIIKYLGSEEHVVIPGEIEGLKVTSIGEDAFSENSSLSSITIPNSVTSIGNWAFYDCSNLTSLEIPESVTQIGEGAFRECSSLSGIVIPKSVTSIGKEAFFRCSSLSGITIPDGVTSIGDSAFASCSSLSSITIPDRVTRIGKRAFYDCRSLSGITIPDGVTSIEDDAFGFCSSLSSIVIPKSVTSIGVYAFFDCSSLSEITIPKSVTSIGGWAFSGCDKLADVYFTGTKADREKIDIHEGNDKLLNATWQYKTSLAKAKVTLAKTKLVYSGKAQKPAVKVMVGNTALKAGTDYTVAYKNNKKIGTANVTITGKGIYTGTATQTFQILPKGTSISKLNAAKKSVTVKWKKQAKETTGYQIQYSLKKNFESVKAVTIKKTKTASTKIKKLKSNKTYYVRIRTYKKVGKKTYYSTWSKAKKVKIK